MKIFNEEVKVCWKCLYFNDPGISGQTEYCRHGGFIIKEPNIIHPDCLFNKPITKEVIEGFGFKTVPFCNIERFELGIYRLYWFIDEPTFISLECIKADQSKTSEHLTLMFRGIVHNPIELEFILRSIGVIE